MELLLKAGLVRKDDDGKWHTCEPFLDTGLETFAHEKMQSVHAQILGTWAKSLGRLSKQDQELGVLNIPLPAHLIPELKEKIREFQDEVIGWVEKEKEKDIAADTISQLGTYLISYR